MGRQLTDSITDALRVLWLARGDQYPDSKDVLAKMIEQGAERPEPNAMLRELQEMRARGLIRITGGVLDSEGVKEHGAVAITWVHPTLLM